MKPVYQISANGRDITDKIGDHLMRLTVVDEAGITSDRITLKLSNRDHALEHPPKGMTLAVRMGYDVPQYAMGLYVVDTIESTGNPHTLTIGAKAADMTGEMKAPKTRSWPLQDFASIVGTIAAEYGLEPAVSAALGAIVPVQIPYAQIEQDAESDLQFLTRLAEQYDAVAKPSGGRLIFVPRGRLVSRTGKDAHKVLIDQGSVSSWSARAPDRSKFAGVSARWINSATETSERVRFGPDGPTYTMNTPFSSEAEALKAAQSKHAQLARQTATLSIEMPGNPEVEAEAVVVFTTKDPLAHGEWIVRRVEHELSGGANGRFSTRMELEPPTEELQP
ncbi:phage late control D family protein [Algimonas porphyrae]|uniref:Phage tail protein n=1 Tax=Algimonas porphyrae TaxID=1128113 RepID=A0ABQ5V1G9_9PROT|nr:contractile injection system protein, VgrG/Pvc8 family [Algimonas porphyrae]GLQ20519.1 phage tail protein [Algimonas porphyrae]